MNRNQWKFEFVANELSKASVTKRDAYAKELKVWETKKVGVIKKIAATGIEVQDSTGDNYKNVGSFGYQSLNRNNTDSVIRIDPKLQQDLQKCQAKVLECREKIDEYSHWSKVLLGNPEKKLKLQHDDYLYFFEKVL